jgi:hypothetical protein
VLFVVCVPVDKKSLNINVDSSAFTFSASSVPLFKVELSGAIVPEKSEFYTSVSGHAEIQMHKQTVQRNGHNGPSLTTLKAKYQQRILEAFFRDSV